jgi:hypothetical protein
MVILMVMLMSLVNGGALANQQPVLKRFEVIDGAYLYKYSQVLNARSHDIYAVLSEHNKISQLNPNVQASAVISRDGDTLKRLLRIKQCIFFFCFKMKLVEYIVETKNEIKSTILPKESDFSEGFSHWRMDSIGAKKTILTLSARQKPNFWIPPIIGAPIIRSVLKEQLGITFNSIRLIAQKKATKK